MTGPFTIGIGGAHSGAGKTTVAVALLRYLTQENRQKAMGEGRGEDPGHRFKPASTTDIPQRSRPKPGDNFSFVTQHRSLITLERWGAIKYTKTAIYSSITDDMAILRRKDKDTRRFLDAGAAHVLWVQSPAAELEEVLPIALDKLCHLDGIIIEGNSAIEFIKPDVVIFVFGDLSCRLKPSAQRMLKRADVVLFQEGSGPPAPDNEAKSERASSLANQHSITSIIKGTTSPDKGLSDETTRKLVEAMEMITRKKDIEALLRESAVNGKISCALARKLAEEAGVSYRDVGKAADELKIKIRECELGCF